MNFTHRSFRPTFDHLEERRVLDGNVAAFVSSGVLVLIGDAAANGLDISQTGFKQFTLTGLTTTSATNINGVANGTFVASNVSSLNVNLSGGDDSLSFGVVTAAPMTFAGNASINMGTGNNFVGTAGGKFLSIFGNLSISNGAGACQTDLTDVNVGGAATLNHLAGGGSNLRIDTSGATPNSFRSLSVVNGVGDDDVRIVDTNFSSSVSIANGVDTLTGGDDVFISEQAAGALLTIGGNLSIASSTIGQATIRVNDYNINGNLSINTGNGGHNNFVGFYDSSTTHLIPTIRGNVSITTAGTGNVEIDVADGGTPLAILGGLTVNASAATGSVIVHEGSLATVGNASATGGIHITTGAGRDDVEIDESGSGSTFNGALFISTGTGDDTVAFNDNAGSATFLFAAVSVNEGAGNDSLQLGIDGPVNFFKTATFSGGATDVDNTFSEVLANVGGGVVLPTLIHYHP